MNPNPPSNPVGLISRDSEPLAIGVLSITAVILLVGILVVTTVNDRALAVGQTDRGGDYIVLGVQFNNGTETVAITDAAAQKVNIYGFDLSSKRIAIWTSQDLKRLQAAAAGQGAGNKPPRRGGRR